jgi:hypothetical protein
VRESPEGVPYSRRVSAASLKQVEAIFENMHVSFQKLLPSTRGQKGERNATVQFDQMSAKVLERSTKVVW